MARGLLAHALQGDSGIRVSASVAGQHNRHICDADGTHFVVEVLRICATLSAPHGLDAVVASTRRVRRCNSIK